MPRQPCALRAALVVSVCGLCLFPAKVQTGQETWASERERSSLRIEREGFLGRPALRLGCYWAVPWHVLGKYLSVAPQCDFLKGAEVLACLHRGGFSERKAAASLLAPGRHRSLREHSSEDCHPKDAEKVKNKCPVQEPL